MTRIYAVRLLAALIFQASVATAEGIVLMDPITTYANGMPLASADPHRDGDLYNGRNRYHVGCIGGCYNTPLHQSLFNPKRCWATCIEKRPRPNAVTPGIVPFGAEGGARYDGIETASVERLGVAPNAAIPDVGGDASQRR